MIHVLVNTLMTAQDVCVVLALLVTANSSHNSSVSVVRQTRCRTNSFTGQARRIGEVFNSYARGKQFRWMQGTVLTESEVLCMF